MSRKLKLKIGQEVAVRREEMRGFSKTLDNIDNWVLEGKVTKVGRKYITVDVGVEHKREIIFDMEDEYREKYDIGMAEYKLFLSKEDIIDDYLAGSLYIEIKRSFSSYSNSSFKLSQLERILEIINE